MGGGSSIARMAGELLGDDARQGTVSLLIVASLIDAWEALLYDSYFVGSDNTRQLKAIIPLSIIPLLVIPFSVIPLLPSQR